MRSRCGRTLVFDSPNRVEAVFSEDREKVAINVL
jgi:hypothetical protein